MNYAVTWTASADAQLTEAWVNARDRAAVTRAANLIERLLGMDPARQGESRSAGVRVLFEKPLVVVYEVIEDDKRVRVLRLASSERGFPPQ